MISARQARLGLGIGLAMVLGLLSVAAGAQQPTQQQAGAIRQFCRSDFASNCAGVPAGGQAALQCLRGHVDTLSPDCQNAVKAIGSASAPAPVANPPAASTGTQTTRIQELRLVRRSCGQDFRSYCQGVELGNGRGLQCLKENESKLSPTCKSALTALPQAQ